MPSEDATTFMVRPGNSASGAGDARRRQQQRPYRPMQGAVATCTPMIEAGPLPPGALSRQRIGASRGQYVARLTQNSVRKRRAWSGSRRLARDPGLTNTTIDTHMKLYTRNRRSSELPCGGILMYMFARWV